MRQNIAVVVPYLIAAAVFLAAVAYVKATRFFAALLVVQPDALDNFRRGPGLPQYGPIAPDRFRYLNAKQFAFLQDTELKRKGSQAYFALAAYAVSFVLLLLSLLLWAS